MAFPFLQALEASEAQRYNGVHTAVQIGDVPPVLFRQVERVGGSWTVPKNRPNGFPFWKFLAIPESVVKHCQ